MKTKKQRIGDWGERIAADFLVQKGYTILKRNFRTRLGEIDIIGLDSRGDERTLCFVEVKTRQKKDQTASRATNNKKLRHIQNAATLYCIAAQIDIAKTPIRFEHISVYYEQIAQATIHHFVIIPSD